MRRILVCGALLAAVARLEAQPTYTLRELLEVGLDRNYSVRIIRNTQQISDNNVTLANAGYLPAVGLSGGYTGTVNNTRTTPAEGEVTSENGVFNQNANAGLNASWYLFDGFRIQTNYKRLQELQNLGEINTRITIEDFIASLTARYYNFIQQKIRLNNLSYAIGLSAERLRIAEIRYSIGSGSRPDVLQAQVDYNADSSRYVNQMTAVRESRIRLNELLANEEVDAPVSIADSLIAIDETLQFEPLRAKTLEVNASLLAADRNTALAELDLKTLQSRNYPYVSMGTGYGYTWNRYGSGNTAQRGVLGFNVGATVGMTIFNGNRRREQSNARISIANSRLREQQLEEALMADLTNFWQAYLNNLKIYRMEQENVKVARINFGLARDRYYNIGNLSGIEMREAQRSLLDAEERLLTAIYNTKVCEISLLQISGGVLHYLEGPGPVLP